MKRLILILLAIAVAGGAYLVRDRYDGDVASAWAAISSRLSDEPRATDRGRSASPSGGPGAAGASRGPARGSGQGGPVPVVTTMAQKVDLPITRSSVGWIEPIATVTLRARIDGQIIEQRVRDGEFVKTGDVLFRLDDREIQAQIARDEAALARDKATLAKVQGDLDRARELLARRVASQAQVDQLAAEVKIAAANVAASEAALEADRIKLGYTAVKAPIEGRVGVVRVTQGNLVRSSDSAGDGLVTITQMRPLRVSFALPERDLELLRSALNDPRQPASVRIFASNSDKAHATGKLTFVDSSVDTTSGTIQAKAVLPNEDGALWPGQYVRVEVELGLRPDVIAVPLIAVQPGQNGSHLFVVRPDRTVEMREVEVADTKDDQAVIAAGLRAGEEVVVEGQVRLRNGTRVAQKNPAPPADPRRTAEAEEGARP